MESGRLPLGKNHEQRKLRVIGEKITAKVLHNGDLVEVDADQKIIKIIK
jgi:hypothetical protein